MTFLFDKIGIPNFDEEYKKYEIVDHNIDPLIGTNG
jgi:hypothetical protein